ncbi:hypothetical protein ACKVMT_02775 [Halobacteriales archaeon Cl-PHB]
MAEIYPDRFSERRRTEGEDVLFLDVRHEADFADWHVLDSVNLDVCDELGDDLEVANAVLEPGANTCAAE